MTKSPNEEETYPLAYDQYEIDNHIGSGAFASVYSAKCLKNNKQVAVKVIELEPDNDDGNDQTSITDIQREAAILHSMKHENIVRCYASFVFQRELWLVMPVLSGSCADIMGVEKKFCKGFKDEGILSTILRDVLNGLNYVHSNNRIHRDVKARNILLTFDGVAKLADFGVSGTLVEGGLRKRGRDTITGTPCWMAPEVMNKEKHNHKADIWSLGITALELAFGKAPNSDKKAIKIMLAIIDNPPPTVDDQGPNDFSRNFKKFVSKCLVKEPQKRSSAKELLDHAFIKQAKDNKYLKEKIIDLTHKKISSRYKPGKPRSIRDIKEKENKLEKKKISKNNTNTQQNSNNNNNNNNNNNINNNYNIDKNNDNKHDNTNSVSTNKDNFRFSQSLRESDVDIDVGVDDNDNTQNNDNTQFIGRFKVTGQLS